MTGLVLKLKPFEKLLVNGAVLQNGPRAARLRVTSAGASILRLRDALHPRGATSPSSNIYYVAQLVVAGEVDVARGSSDLSALIESASLGATREEERSAYQRAAEALRRGKFYSVMRAVRPLMADTAPQGPPSQ